MAKMAQLIKDSKPRRSRGNKQSKEQNSIAFSLNRPKPEIYYGQPILTVNISSGGTTTDRIQEFLPAARRFGKIG